MTGERVSVISATSRFLMCLMPSHTHSEKENDSMSGTWDFPSFPASLVTRKKRQPSFRQEERRHSLGRRERESQEITEDRRRESSVQSRRLAMDSRRGKGSPLRLLEPGSQWIHTARYGLTPRAHQTPDVRPSKQITLPLNHTVFSCLACVCVCVSRETQTPLFLTRGWHHTCSR